MFFKAMRVASSVVPIDSSITIKVESGFVVLSHSGADYKYFLNQSVLFNFNGTNVVFSVNSELAYNSAKLRSIKKLVGFYVRDFHNFVSGILTPFFLTIVVVGIGYKVNLNTADRILVFSLGYSHDIMVNLPVGVHAEVTQDKILLRSRDKALLGSFASCLCNSLRKFDVFKGKGLVRLGSFMRRKELKKK